MTQKNLKKFDKNASNLKQITKIQDDDCFYLTEALDLKAKSLLIKFMQGLSSWQIYLPLGGKVLK